MDEDIRRVTGTVLRAPFTRRTVHELLYCGFGGITGVIGFSITVVMLALGLTISASVLGTVVGLLLLILALRVSRRLGGLHRRLASWLLRYQVEAPPKFQRGTGILNRIDKRLRDRAAWRGVTYNLVKLPVAAVQLYAITIACIGLADITYPVDWVLFRHGATGPMVVVFPLLGGTFNVYGFLGTYLAAIAGAFCVLAGTWLARGINAGDRRLVRSLLGRSSMSERVSELERTRTLAVEDSAAALRRVERDLHDGAQMRLAALAMNLGMAREKLGEDDDQAGLPGVGPQEGAEQPGQHRPAPRTAVPCAGWRRDPPGCVQSSIILSLPPAYEPPTVAGQVRLFAIGLPGPVVIGATGLAKQAATAAPAPFTLIDTSLATPSEPQPSLLNDWSRRIARNVKRLSAACGCGLADPNSRLTSCWSRPPWACSSSVQ